MLKKLPFTRIAIIPENVTTHELFTKFEQIIERGADAIYLRTNSLLNAELEKWVHLMEYPNITWLGSVEYSIFPFVKGIHYKASQESNDVLESHVLYRGKSCHTLEELKKAEERKYDYIFLSPVFSTATHPQIPPLGLNTFREWVAQVKIPVFALGGVRISDIPLLIEAGAYGIAGISCFWED